MASGISHKLKPEGRTTKNQTRGRRQLWSLEALHLVVAVIGAAAATSVVVLDQCNARKATRADCDDWVPNCGDYADCQ
jgi:hypothetical protein